MSLRGQDDGYAMAALLVAMSVMALMLAVAMPSYKQLSRREKEEELVFRGRQYARAIGLFQKKYANAFPPDLDVLVREHFLRKKYKDPITNDDFQPLTQAQPTTPGSGSATAARPGMTGAVGPTGATGATGATNRIGTTASGGFGTNLGSAAGGGIIGVASKSKDTSLRVYNGRTHYNEWVFMFTPQMMNPGGVPGGAPGVPGRPGQPGQPGAPGGTARPGQPRTNSNSPFGYRVGPNGEIQTFGTPPTGGAPMGRPGGFNPAPVPPSPATQPRRPGR